MSNKHRINISPRSHNIYQFVLQDEELFELCLLAFPSFIRNEYIHLNNNFIALTINP